MFYHQDPLSKYYARLSCFCGIQVSSLTKIHKQESRHSNTTKFQDLGLKFRATRPSFQDSGSHDSSIRPKSICPTNSCGHNVCERRSRYAYFNHVGTLLDAVRKTMLCTALRDEPEFFSLQHQDNIFQAQGNSPITYDNYLALLRSTAFNIDSRHTGKPRRQANTANQTSSSSSSHNKGGHGKGGSSHGSKGGIPIQIAFQSRKKSGVNYLPTLDRLSSLRTSPNIRLTLVNKKTQARYPRHYGINFLLMQERLLLLLTKAIGLVIKAVRQLYKIVHLSLKLP